MSFYSKRFLGLALLAFAVFFIPAEPAPALAFDKTGGNCFPRPRQPRLPHKHCVGCNRYKGGKVLVPGPAAAQRPNAQQVQQILQEQQSGSPTELAVSGLSGVPNCDIQLSQFQGQMQAIVAQAWALYYQYMAQLAVYDSQWKSWSNKSTADITAYYSSWTCSCSFCACPYYACPTCYNDYLYDNAQMTKVTNDMIAYTNVMIGNIQALGLQVAALGQTWMAAASQCSRPSSPLAQPPAMNMDMLAKKFNFSFPAVVGEAVGPTDGQLYADASSAWQQLESLAAEASDASAGSAGSPARVSAWDKAARQYDRHTFAAQAYGAQLDRLQRLGESAARKANHGDIRAGYALAYYQASFNDLGPKYKVAQQQESDQAMFMAQAALNEITADGAQAIGGIGVHEGAKDTPPPPNPEPATDQKRGVCGRESWWFNNETKDCYATEASCRAAFRSLPVAQRVNGRGYWQSR